MAANNNRLKKLNRIPNLPTSVRIVEIISQTTMTNTWSSAIRLCIESVRTVVPMNATSRILAICKPSAILRLMTASQW